MSGSHLKSRFPEGRGTPEWCLWGRHRLGFYTIRLGAVPYGFSPWVRVPPPNPTSALYTNQRRCSPPHKAFLSGGASKVLFSHLGNVSQAVTSLLLTPCGVTFSQVSASSIQCLFLLCFLKPRATPEIKTPSDQCPRSLCFFPPLLL